MEDPETIQKTWVATSHVMAMVAECYPLVVVDGSVTKVMDSV